MSVSGTGGVSLKLLSAGMLLKGISSATGQAIKRDFVDVFVENAKDKAPVLTGNLKRSIAADDKSLLRWEITTATGYGAYVELGTKHMAAQPYFAPAYEVARKQFERTAFK